MGLPEHVNMSPVDYQSHSLIHSHSSSGVAFLDKLLERGDLVEPPQHGHVLETEVFGLRNNIRAPSVDTAKTMSHL